MAKPKIGKTYNKFMDDVENRRQRRADNKVRRSNERRASRTRSYVERTPSYVTRKNAEANLYMKKKTAKNIKAIGHAAAENTAGPSTAASYVATENAIDEKKKKRKEAVPTTSVMYQGSYDNDELDNMPGGDSEIWQRR